MHRCRGAHDHKDVGGRATQGAVAEDVRERSPLGTIIPEPIPHLLLDFRYSRSILIKLRMAVGIMAFSEFEKKRIEKIIGRYIESRRPPPHIRTKLDLGFRVTGQSFELFEIRPPWRGDPKEKLEHPYAKATFVKTQKVWKIYWQRADLKWHRYEPVPTQASLEDVLAMIEHDEYHCFYG